MPSINFIVVIVSAVVSAVACSADKPPFLLVISLDGFRHDYLEKHANPHGFLNRIAKEGVRARWTQPVYPTNTYPNHWAMATGLYPESNGVLNNDVYDPHTNDRWVMTESREDSHGWFQQAEPVWILNRRAAADGDNDEDTRHSVVMDWPGSSAPFLVDSRTHAPITGYDFRQVNTDLYKLETYNATVSLFVDKIDPARTNLAMLYFCEPDCSAHNFGPDSGQVRHVVQELDYVLENLFRQLQARKQLSLVTPHMNEQQLRPIDLIILTDHGMTSISPTTADSVAYYDRERHVYLSDYVDVSATLVAAKCSQGSIAELWPVQHDNATLIEEIYAKLKAAAELNKARVQGVYLKSEIPERFYIKSHRRVAPIIVVATEGHQIYLSRQPGQVLHGNHGYDPSMTESMRGTFLAHGKSFKRAFFYDGFFHVIDTYSLLCHLLRLTPREHNGTFARVEHLLASSVDVAVVGAELVAYAALTLVVLVALVSLVLPSSQARKTAKSKAV